MKSYYIHRDDKKQGPYSLDQLKEMQINPAVPVWTEGLKEWINARELPELQTALFSSPPQFVPTYSESGVSNFNSTTEKTGFIIGRNWKIFLGVIVLTTIITLVIQSQNSKSNSPRFGNAASIGKTPEQLREELRQLEMTNPSAYIKHEANWRINLIDETVLEGTLSNTATIANFKDAILLVTWISKTNTFMGTKRCPVYEFLGAGKSIPFKLKLFGPSKFKAVQLSIESATAIE